MPLLILGFRQINKWFFDVFEIVNTFPDRSECGYFLGLEVIKKMETEMTFEEILALSWDVVQMCVCKTLEMLAK